jgi:hypothetical protein|uniref:Uncharacterized protein n=1 Tax=Phage sp. ctGns7 TaxID=2828003 RepID=A0A8S5S8P3_9VIRU|nr:MAG TPA: hypothetical protein [Phage sp. ctGns7]
MKHKFDSYSITDIVGVLDKNENNELCIFVELKDNIKEVPIIDLLDTMVGNTVQIKTILEKE